MAPMSNQVDRHYYEVATPGSTSEKLAAIARDKIYTDFLRLCGPSASDGFSMWEFRTLLPMRPTSLSAVIRLSAISRQSAKVRLKSG